MKIPLQVTFREMTSSPSLEALIERQAAKLEHFYPRIQRCHVVIEAAYHRRQRQPVFNVGIDVKVPGGELAIGREASQHQAYADVHIGIRDAFHAMRRQLQDFARRQRGDVKSAEPPPHARVTKLFPKEGYGFLEDEDGREIYFHAHSVLSPGFERLEIGSEVRFQEEQGNQGPQASTVELMG